MKKPYAAAYDDGWKTAVWRCARMAHEDGNNHLARRMVEQLMLGGTFDGATKEFKEEVKSAWRAFHPIP